MNCLMVLHELYISYRGYFVIESILILIRHLSL